MQSSSAARRLRALRLLVALVGALGLVALAPQLASADAPGGISGLVTNASGTALSNVRVDLEDLDTQSFYGGQTAGDGTYSIGNLPAGHYQVLFRPTSGQNYVYQHYPDKPNTASAQPVLITSGQTTSSVNAVLATGATISGHVQAATGGGGAQRELLARRRRSCRGAVLRRCRHAGRCLAP
ncbi:MAG: carboxypeptidase regulatory-like domain-containing protein [Mycobacteriaceae bacterium]|nr:carboxypeptidase regulatory-like domain-containing protein [Mycobacteriaceae bacterium]